VASRDRRKHTEESHAEDGAVVGALTGAGVGALVGLGILAGVIPAIGPVIAGGALASLLANAAGGAAIVGLVGTLIGLGIPEEDAQFYESELKAGRTVVTVQAGNRIEEARAILYRHNGYSRENAPAARTQAFARTCATGTDEHLEDARTVQLKEERLEAHKTPVQKGEVKVRKEVVTEQQTLNVPVRREEVVVERRRPASGSRTPATSIREGEEVRIPVHEERVTIEKRPVVREEVRVGKRQVTGTKQVSGTVKREEARIERQGDVKTCEPVTSTPPGSRTRTR